MEADALAFTNIELKILDSFFNNDGYVMDFSSNDLDKFTYRVVAIPIVTKYQMSKAKSLDQFFSDADNVKALNLLNSLLQYFEIYQKKHPQSDNVIRMNQFYDSVFKIAQFQNYATPIKKILDNSSLHSKKLNHEFIRKRLNDLEKAMNEDSSASIGASKDLLESVLKMILDDANISYSNSKGRTDNIPILWNKVQTELQLKPKDMPETDIGKSSRKILDSISKIILGMDELRNHYGTGHGRNINFKLLPNRYGKLTIAMTISLIEFLLDTTKDRQAKVN